MIKIGTKNDLPKISHLPMNIQNAICEDVGILDNFYGENRNIDVDMGGFVVVCDKDEKLDIVHFDKILTLLNTYRRFVPIRKCFLFQAQSEISSFMNIYKLWTFTRTMGFYL